MNPLQLFFSSPMVQDEDWKRHTHTHLPLSFSPTHSSLTHWIKHAHPLAISQTHSHTCRTKAKKDKILSKCTFYLTFKPASSPKPSSSSFFLSLLVQMTAASKKPLQSLSVIMCLPVRTMVVRAQFDFCSLSLPLFCNRSGSSFILWAHFIRMRLKSVPRSKQNEWPKSRQV